MFDIERYLNIRSAFGGSFCADGTLTFLLDTTGVPQVWSLPEPGRWPEQRTFYDERVTFAAPSPERDEVIFGMDVGGNERGQFYRLDLGTGHVATLTDIPDAKHRWGGWASDGDQFAFASNRRDEGVFDVYTQSRDGRGEEARLVFEGDGWFSVGGWSPDDTRLIVTESHSSFDQDVYVLDVDSTEFRHVTPHEGPVRYGNVEWGPDGDGLYFTTDAESDTTYLAHLDLDSLDLSVVEADAEWNIDGLRVHEDTGRIVYSRNVDGYSVVTTGTLTDEASIEPLPQPDLPRGVAGSVDFTPDGAVAAVTVSGRTHPTNVYGVHLETGGVEQWTRTSTAGIPRDSFVGPETVRFESFDGRAIPGLLSLPPGTGEQPTIVDIHGGPESQRRPSFAPVSQYFIANGYAVFEPNVRGSTGYGKAFTRLDDRHDRMDAVGDLRAGVEWLREHPRIDPDRIAALGASYGGFMVLAALTEYPELWAAGVDIVGIANFVTFLENTGDWRRSLREAEYGSLAEDRAFLEAISPTTNIEGIEAPLLVLHGANDPRVPVSEAEQIAEDAAQHVPTETVIFEDEGHGFSKLDNRITAYQTIVEFLDTHV